MSVDHFDLIVSGGGPAGSAAAWTAARLGMRVLLCDKATFPRDKPCGDGITPRSVRLLSEMGLGEELRRFHRVDAFRLVAPAGAIDRKWPSRPELPGHGYVIPRTDLDALLIEAAAKAGAEVRQGAEVVGPLTRDGQVSGVRIRTSGVDDIAIAPISIAADGMSSRLGRLTGLTARRSPLFAVAVRAQVPTARPDDAVLECHGTLRRGRHLLPGYGWVFPMGNGMVNVGIGYSSTYRDWQSINANHLLGDFLRTLPPEWKLPEVPDMIRSGSLSGWRLPMALGVWPPWTPGLMGAGDAVGAAKPFTGAGISKALQSGRLAAEVAHRVLGSGDPADLKEYERKLRGLWGGYYALGRAFSTAIGSPRVMSVVTNSAVRASRATDFLVAVATGNGTERSYEQGMTGLVASGIVRAAGYLPARRRQEAAAPPSARVGRARASGARPGDGGSVAPSERATAG